MLQQEIMSPSPSCIKTSWRAKNESLPSPDLLVFIQPSNPPKRQILSFTARCSAPMLTVLAGIRTTTAKSYPNTCYKLLLAASYKVLLFITFTFWFIPLSSSPMSTVLSSL